MRGKFGLSEYTWGENRLITLQIKFPLTLKKSNPTYYKGSYGVKHEHDVMDI